MFFYSGHIDFDGGMDVFFVVKKADECFYCAGVAVEGPVGKGTLGESGDKLAYVFGGEISWIGKGLGIEPTDKFGEFLGVEAQGARRNTDGLPGEVKIVVCVVEFYRTDSY